VQHQDGSATDVVHQQTAGVVAQVTAARGREETHRAEEIHGTEGTLGQHQQAGSTCSMDRHSMAGNRRHGSLSSGTMDRRTMTSVPENIRIMKRGGTLGAAPSHRSLENGIMDHHMCRGNHATGTWRTCRQALPGTKMTRPG